MCWEKALNKNKAGDIVVDNIVLAKNLTDKEFVQFVEYNIKKAKAKYKDLPNDQALAKYLQDLADKIKLRKKALKDLITKYGNNFIKEQRIHRDGFVDFATKIDKLGNTKILKKGKGGHSYEAVLEGKLKIKGNTIPPNPKDDEPFVALLQMYDKTNPKSFVNKSNSTLRINGKQNRAASTMFPKNWDNLRIEEEIAFAYKNKKFVESIKKGQDIVEVYRGKATTSMEIEFIFNNGKLSTTPPIVKHPIIN